MFETMNFWYLSYIKRTVVERYCCKTRINFGEIGSKHISFLSMIRIYLLPQTGNIMMMYHGIECQNVNDNHKSKHIG